MPAMHDRRRSAWRNCGQKQMQNHRASAFLMSALTTATPASGASLPLIALGKELHRSDRNMTLAGCVKVRPRQPPCAPGAADKRGGGTLEGYAADCGGWHQQHPGAAGLHPLVASLRPGRRQAAQAAMSVGRDHNLFAVYMATTHTGQPIDRCFVPLVNNLTRQICGLCLFGLSVPAPRVHLWGRLCGRSTHLQSNPSQSQL